LSERRKAAGQPGLGRSASRSRAATAPSTNPPTSTPLDESHRGTFSGSRGVLMGPHGCEVHADNGPVDRTDRVRVLLDVGQEAVPGAVGRPAAETFIDRLPRAIPLGQVPLTSSCTVSGEASRIAAGRCSQLSCRCQVRGPVVGQQSGDGLDGVAHVLAAAEVAGQDPPVLQVSNAVFDPDASRGVLCAVVRASPRTSRGCSS
jgi:hypothetical protein